MKQNDGLKKSAKWLRVACIGVAAGLGALGNAHALATIEPPPEQAVWVFSDINSPANPVSNPVARQALISNSAASRVKALYVSVYRSTRAQPISNAGRLMYEDADMADLIAKAHAQGMTVLAAYGAPKWPSLGCSVNAFPLARLDEVAAYNHANPKAAFDGVMLDIEPSAPIDFVALLTQYRCFLTAAQASNLKLGAAIRLGWKDIVTFEGISKEFYKHVLDMLPLDSRVVVMGYRDFAGTSAPGSDGIIASNQDQFAYAASIGKKQMMLAGLETSNLAATGTANKKTFFEEGQGVLNSVAQIVFNYFGYNGMGGFAIHNYGNSYLSGASAKWPLTNPDFPQFVLTTQAGPAVTATSPVPVNAVNVKLLNRTEPNKPANPRKQNVL